MTAYRDALQKWFDHAVYTKGSLSGDLLTSAMQFSSYLHDSKFSDKELENYAFALKDGFNNGSHHRSKEDSKEVYLCPLRSSDGTVTYIDRNNNGKVLFWVKPTKDGPIFHGDWKYITTLGGRNELGGIIKMSEDGDIVHDGNYVMKKK